MSTKDKILRVIILEEAKLSMLFPIKKLIDFCMELTLLTNCLKLPEELILIRVFLYWDHLLLS